MPTRSRRLVPISLLTLSLVLLPAVSQAASYPTVLHRLGDSELPPTPAYRSAAIKRDLTVLKSSTKPRTVNIVVDTSARLNQLATYAANTTNPQSKEFHQFLTPAQLQKKFGPTRAMLRQAESTMAQAGWHVVHQAGLIVTATIPQASQNPGLPVSPDIWSMTDIAPHGLIRQAVTPQPSASANNTPALSLTGEDFNEPPDVIQQTTASNGDVLSIMSWNPLVASAIPAGMPINLFVTVQDPQGNFLPIQNVGNLNDSDQSLVSYGTSAMPDSSNTLWQVPIAAWQDIAPGDTLTLQATLPSGTVLNGSFPLPSFTGSSTVLTPLDAQQLNELSGLGETPANPGPIGLFTIGAPPDTQDLSLYLAQNGTPASLPNITFHYEDGATANEYGEADDSEESQLDLEAAAGAAPGAPISEYVYPENDANDPLISYLTDLSQQSSVKIANLSYGFFGEDLSTLTALMNALTAEGVTLLEASGDQGAWNGGNDPGPVGLSSLEQVPSVLSVGGTDIAAPARTDNNGNTIAITGSLIADAWGGDFLDGIPVAVAQAYTNANAASSGGYSSSTPAPYWEETFLPPNATGFGVPIISSLGGFPGMSGYLQQQDVIFGGTSLASPLTAGWLDETEAALGLTQTGLGNVNPLIFQEATANPQIFTQALWGQDGVYTVTTSQAGSWNPLTGLGMMNWGDFLADYDTLVPASPPAATLAAAAKATVGQTELVTAYVRGIADPVYQFSYQSPQNGVWTPSGTYSPSNAFRFKVKVPGTYIAQVQVKGTGGTAITREARIAVSTRLPMVSGLVVHSSLKSQVLTAHSQVRITARATDPGHHPEYEFWLQSRSSAKHIVRGWSASPAYTIKNLKAGRYAVTIDALDHTEIMAHNWAAAYRHTLNFAVR